MIQLFLMYDDIIFQGQYHHSPGNESPPWYHLRERVCLRFKSREGVEGGHKRLWCHWWNVQDSVERDCVNCFGPLWPRLSWAPATVRQAPLRTDEGTAQMVQPAGWTSAAPHLEGTDVGLSCDHEEGCRVDQRKIRRGWLINGLADDTDCKLWYRMRVGQKMIGLQIPTSRKFSEMAFDSVLPAKWIAFRSRVDPAISAAAFSLFWAVVRREELCIFFFFFLQARWFGQLER